MNSQNVLCVANVFLRTACVRKTNSGTKFPQTQAQSSRAHPSLGKLLSENGLRRENELRHKVPENISRWADVFRECSAWLNHSFEKIQRVQTRAGVRGCSGLGVVKGCALPFQKEVLWNGGTDMWMCMHVHLCGRVYTDICELSFVCCWYLCVHGIMWRGLDFKIQQVPFEPLPWKPSPSARDVDTVTFSVMFSVPACSTRR